jgi:hypothetical protein
MNLRVQGEVFLLVTTRKTRRCAWASSRKTRQSFCVNYSAELQTVEQTGICSDSLVLLRTSVFSVHASQLINYFCLLI